MIEKLPIPTKESRDFLQQTKPMELIIWDKINEIIEAINNMPDYYSNQEKTPN